MIPQNDNGLLINYTTNPLHWFKIHIDPYLKAQQRFKLIQYKQVKDFDHKISERDRENKFIKETIRSWQIRL